LLIKKQYPQFLTAPVRRQPPGRRISGGDMLYRPGRGVDAMLLHVGEYIGVFVSDTAVHLIIRDANSPIALVRKSLELFAGNFRNFQWPEPTFSNSIHVVILL
jgi:hypothetical protein